MRYIQFNFIDETFGEEIECLIIWDNEEFIIISIHEEEIRINKYNNIKNLIKEIIANKSELDFLRNLTVEQEKEIDRLEGLINEYNNRNSKEVSNRTKN